jgi:transposase
LHDLLRDVIDVSTETDIERLRQVAQLLVAENDRLHQRLQVLSSELAKAEGKDAERLQLELDLLREQLHQRNQTIFGTSSEKGQKARSARAEEETPKKPQSGHGPGAQPELLIHEEVFELDEADQACPKCGGELTPMEGQFEESEVVDVVERSFHIVKEKRQKYTCSCGECVETALGSTKPIAGGRYSLPFAALVASEKYEDHNPLARQVRQMGRVGLAVTSQTLWDQTLALSQHLAPSYWALKDFVLEAGVVGMDETRWPLLAKGKTKKWWVWSLCRPEAVFYQIAATRSAAEVKALLGDYTGVVMCDGYAAYPSFVKGRDAPGPLVLANCWSHARRKFVQAAPNYPVADEMVELIAQLYAVEAEAGEDPVLRAELRRLKSQPVIDEIQAWLLSQRALPKSSLGKAITYTSKLWAGLTYFLGDPGVPLDNNGTERSIRGIALGRKNHYGSKSQRGTEVAAILYSLIESAKLAGLSGRVYLEEAARRAILNPGTITLPHELANS